MNGFKARTYAEKMNKVCDYIDQHLEEDFSLEQLSQLANFSKFHFLRQFTAYTGIAVFKYIQLKRLKQASFQLAFKPEIRIIDIALEAKFENPESFSRAFKAVFSQTPSQFRKAPQWSSWNEKFQLINAISERKTEMEIKLINFDETKIAILEHRGPADRVLESAAKFIEWRKQSQLSPVKSSATYGVPYDDPNTTEPEKFRFDICGAIDCDVPENPQGVKTGLIPGGRCAVARHYGSHDKISDTVYAMYREWLPESGEELRDFPVYFHYLNLIPEVAEHELMTDVYLPLK